ncbi:transposase [Methylosinus sp. Sm6]|uniref:transposase n=1 Tax=Methylosinus sp. Sm6 TaxID=2866948 RepID=UPI001C9A04E4|nr:transposase [Methylosinus sp. Sm6]
MTPPAFTSLAEDEPSSREPDPQLRPLASMTGREPARPAETAGNGLDDDEWTLLAPLVIETGPKRGRPPRDHRRVLDGIFWIAGNNAPWRELPARYGNWSSVYRQFLRWSRLGLFEQMIDAAATDRAALAKRLAAARALAARRRTPAR